MIGLDLSPCFLVLIPTRAIRLLGRLRSRTYGLEW